MNWLIRFLATGFFVGHVPYAPGTAGTFVGLLLYVIFPKNPVFYWVFILCLVISGTILSHLAEEIFDEIDSPKIVIDEICGYFVSMGFLFKPDEPKRLGLILLGFIIFRFLDITKIYPIKKLQNISGGLGIMLDDIYAGIVTNLILQVIHKL